MKLKLIPLILAGTALITACDEVKNTTTASVPAIAKENAIASVNGKFISKEALTSLETELAQRGKGQTFPKVKLIEELVQRELLVQEASKKKLDQSAEYTNQLEMIKKSLLSQAAIQNFLKSNPITDADLEAEYNKTFVGSGTEYKARHILVKSEDEAKALIKELDAGADFVELAKSKSTGPSGPQGGDLGWFADGQMVAPFSEAVIALEDNKYTAEAVETQFGWHVILREGSRAQTPPPLEAVKEQMRPMLQRKKIQDFMGNLRQQATIKILYKEPVATPEPVVAVQEKPAVLEKVLEKASDVEVTDKAVDLIKDATKVVNNVSEKATEESANSIEKATNAVEAIVESTEQTKNAIKSMTK